MTVTFSLNGCGPDQSPPNPSRDTLDHDPVSQFRIWGRCHAVTVGVKSEPQSLWPTKYKLPQYTGTCRETTLQFPCALPEEGMRWIEHGDRCSSGFPCFFRSRGKHVLSCLENVLSCLAKTRVPPVPCRRSTSGQVRAGRETCGQRTTIRKKKTARGTGGFFLFALVTVVLSERRSNAGEICPERPGR